MNDNRYSHYGDATECFTALIAAQPAIERLSFKKLLMEDVGLITSDEPATEAFTGKPPIQGAGRSRLVELLYQDVMTKGARVDFGTIPQSRGDITKFQYYKIMIQSIDSLNQLLGDRANEGMVRMNSLHEAIIEERMNFEMGYKLNIEFLQYFYCSMVAALMDVIDENIVAYVDYLKETQNVELPKRVSAAANTRVDSAVDSWLNMRKKGEWKRIVDSFKKDYTKRFVSDAMVIATVSVIGLVASLWAVRGLIYTYFYTSVRIDEKARAMSNYLNAVSATETNDKAKKRQVFFSSKLDNVATFIETRIIKDNPRIEKELQMSDAAINKNAMTNMTITQVNTAPDDSGYDFEF